MKTNALLHPVFRVASLVAVVASCAMVPAAAQTVAYYRFNDGPNGATVDTVFDSGPNGLNGTSLGTKPLKYTSNVAPFPSTGGFALDASGDYNFVSVPHSDKMIVQGGLTVETFVRPNSPYDGAGSGYYGDTVVAKQNTLNSGYHLSAWEIEYSQDKGIFSCHIGFAGDSGVDVYGTKDFRDGKWHHVAMVLNRNAPGNTQDLTLYVDGIKVAQTTGNWPDLYYGTQPLFIGAGNYNTGDGTGTYRRNFGGLIDEVRITAAALQSGQFLNATPDNGIRTMSGTLLFDGITAVAPPQNVTFELRPMDNSGNFNRTLSVPPTGEFNLSVPPKNFTVHIKADKYLAKNIDADVTTGSASGLKVKLQAGDSNNDNVVDIADFGALVNAYNSDITIPKSGYDAHADFNSDGIVDIADFGLLVNSYNLSGDL